VSFSKFQLDKFDVFFPPLVLLTPFLSFVKYNTYPIFSIDILLLFFLIIIIGLVFASLGGLIAEKYRPIIPFILIILFLSFQFPYIKWRDITTVGLAVVLLFLLTVIRLHSSKIGTIVFGTILIFTLLIPVGKPGSSSTGKTSKESPNSQLPVIIHVLLDGHIGVEGIPTNIDGGDILKRELKLFYLKHGFRLFGKAYSHHFASVISIAHLFNYLPTPNEGGFVQFPKLESSSILEADGISNFAFNLKQNGFFELIRNKGYRINVYQPNYLNVCPSDEETVAKCYTYSYLGLDETQTLPLTIIQRVRVIASVYLSTNEFYSALRFLYEKIRESGVGGFVKLPSWNWEDVGYTSLTFLPAFKKFKEDLLLTSAGNYFFAHFLAPHEPYVFDPNCKIIPLIKWMGKNERHGENSREDRTKRYLMYFKQIKCVMKKLDDFLSEIANRKEFLNSIVIIQGDHGSRINIFDPTISNINRMVKSDFVDGYSTLFAVRSLGIPKGYDLTFISIQKLLSKLMISNFQCPLNFEASRSSPIIFLSSRDLNSFKKIPMIDFGKNDDSNSGMKIETSSVCKIGN